MIEWKLEIENFSREIEGLICLRDICLHVKGNKNLWTSLPSPDRTYLSMGKEGKTRLLPYRNSEFHNSGVPLAQRGLCMHRCV